MANLEPIYTHWSTRSRFQPQSCSVLFSLPLLSPSLLSSTGSLIVAGFSLSSWYMVLFQVRHGSLLPPSPCPVTVCLADCHGSLLLPLSPCSVTVPLLCHSLLGGLSWFASFAAVPLLLSQSPCSVTVCLADCHGLLLLPLSPCSVTVCLAVCHGSLLLPPSPCSVTVPLLCHTLLALSLIHI